MSTCTYCGSLDRIQRDHVVPVSSRLSGNRPNQWRLKDTVPCCLQCNAILSNRMLLTVELRAEFLFNHYNKKRERFTDLMLQSRLIHLARVASLPEPSFIMKEKSYRKRHNDQLKWNRRYT